MKRKRNIIIILSAVILLACLYGVFNNKKNDSYTGEKQAEIISIEENGNNNGFVIDIYPSYIGKQSRIEIRIYYYNSEILHLRTYVKNNRQPINEDFFYVDYQNDYVKLSILDCDKKVTGVYRAYVNSEIHSGNDASRDGE